MTTKFLKKNLLATASVLALGAFASQSAFAADVSRADGGTTAITAGQTLDFTGTEDVLTGIATVADGITIGAVAAPAGDGAGNGSGATHGTGTLTFSGSGGTSTIATTTDRLGLLNAGANGATVTVSGASFINNTSITGTGTLALGGLMTASGLNYAADGVVTVASGIGLTTPVTSSLASTTVGQGTLTFLGGTQTQTGAVGTGTNYLKAVNSTVAGAATTFSSNVYAVTTTIGSGSVTVNGTTGITGTTLAFSGDGTLTLADSADVVMTSITAANGGTTTGAGTIHLAGTTDRLVSGNVGTSSNYLKKIDFTGANKATTNGDLYVATIDFADTASTLEVVNGKLIAGTVIDSSAGKGTLTFTGATTSDSTITGAVGGSTTGILALNHIAGLDGSVLTLNGASNYITTTNVGAGQLVLNGNLTGDLNFDGSADTTGAATIDGGKTLTGLVKTATADEGIVHFDADTGTTTTVTSTIGADNNRELLRIEIDGTGTVALQGDTKAETIRFDADGLVTVADDVEINTDGSGGAEGSIAAGEVKTATTNTGTVSFLGTSVVATDLGETAKLLKAVNVLGTSGAAGTKTVTLGSVYATNVTLGDHVDDVITLAIADGKTLKAAVGTYTDGDGTLNYVGGATQTGDVGTSSKKLLLVQVDSGNSDSKTVAVTGDIYATTVNFVGNSTLSLADNSDVTAAITNTTDNEGTITVLGSSTFTGNIGTNTTNEIATLNVNSAASNDVVTFNNDVYVTTFDAGSGAAGAEISIAAGKKISADAQFTAARTGDAKYTFNVKEVAGGTDLVGQMESTAGGAASFVNSIINVAVDSGSDYIADASQYLIIVGNTGAATVPTASITDNSYTLDFTLEAGGGANLGTANDLVAIADRVNTFQSAAATGNHSAVGTALETIQNTGDDDLDTVVGALDSLTTAAAVDSALETLNPDMSGAVTSAALSAGDAGLSVVGGRMDQLASAEADAAGIATGGSSHRSGVWGQVFGAASDQGDRRGVKGYQAETGGFAFGADTNVSDQANVGASFAYGNTDADSANGSSEIDTYQGTVYGTYDYGQWYSEALVSFAQNDFNTTRNIVVGSISDQAKGDFSGQQYSAKVGGGYKVKVGGGLNVTPIASLQYTLLTLDSYTETGSSANLTVDNDDINILKSEIGTKLSYPIVDGGITYIPEIRASWFYDFIGDEQEATNKFTSVATTFNTKGASVARNSFDIGLGLDILAQDNVTVSFDYDWISKEDFESHNGSIKARLAF